MSATIASTPRPTREPRNGVNTPVLIATVNAVKDAPALAQFQFRASNRWVGGTHSETSIETFSGAGADHAHKTEFRYGADHPAVLVGEVRGPTPIEFLLHGLASCITAGIGNVAAARGVTLTSIESPVEGDIDLQGILGISDQGSQRLPADPHQLRLSKAMRRRRSCARSSSSRAPDPPSTTS